MRKQKQTSAHARLLVLQKRIYRALEKEAESLLGPTPPGIKKYEKRFREDFKLRGKRLEHIRKTELIKKIRAADVSWVADFHTFQQAQRTVLRLIREVVRPKEDWYVGLEMIPSQYQSSIDLFLAGKVSLTKLKELIHYEEEWGFPWQHYIPLFNWAKAHGVGILALNRPKQLLYKRDRFKTRFTPVAKIDEKELHDRDLWAAGVVTDLFAEARNQASGKKRKPKVIALYGDLHVASAHLAARTTKISRAFLGKPLHSLSIHQNHPEVYWKLASQSKELYTQVVKLKKDVYCVLSATPWARLQSLVSWLGNEVELESNTETDWESDTDDLLMIQSYGKILSEFLGVPLPSFDQLAVRTIAEADFLDAYKKDLRLSSQDRALIRYHIVNNIELYVPQLPLAYVGSTSENRAAEMAALHLLSFARKSKRAGIFANTVDDFYRLALESAFGFFGSLILNHKRKCDLHSDHLQRLAQLERTEKEAFRWEREIRYLAATFLGKASPAKKQNTLLDYLSERRLAPAVVLAARFTGQVLGRSVHQLILSEKVEIARIVQLFKQTGKKENHAEIYAALSNLSAKAKLQSTKLETI